jgi:hypothetical protein
LSESGRVDVLEHAARGFLVEAAAAAARAPTAGGRQTTGRRSVRTGRYGSIVVKQVYEFDARLVGCPGVRQKIGVRSDQTFVHLHRALQLAFGWDDDHLYTFWLGTKFWPRAGTEFCNPFSFENPSFENPSPLAAFSAGEPPRKRSAETRLDRARLLRGEKLAYVFDFGDEWRVLLTLKTIRADDRRRYPLVLAAVGDAPPQYPDEADAA